MLIVEPILVISEIRYIKSMQKLKVKGFEKLGEQDRRRKWGKMMSCLALVSIILFIGCTVSGFVLIKGRSCADRQALEDAVCVDCVDD